MASEERCPYCGEIVDRTDKDCPHCQRRITAKALLDNPPGPSALPAGIRPTPVTTMSSATILLLLAGVVACGIGALSLSQATMGVGFIGGGCFLAIWARVIQAGVHHREIAKAMSAARTIDSASG